MDVGFDDIELDELETNPKARPRFPTGVIKAYRKRLWQIRAVHDERDFYANRGFNFESIISMPGRYSIRLNDQFRLIIRFEDRGKERTVVVVAIQDYH